MKKSNEERVIENKKTFYINLGFEDEEIKDLLIHPEKFADVEEEIPAINALGYYSKSEGRFKTYEEALDEEAKLLNTYHQFIYNCLFDKENRNSFFFPRLNQDP